MPIRFIRRPSDVPSISNFDDARSIRYAYGGQDGFVQKAGNELSYTVTGSTFRINSGVVVLQGWESEVDSNGWEMTVDNVATKRYYSVYYEVNLAMQTTEIKSVYDAVNYPEVDAGDDLTSNQAGTARLLLYHFTAQNGEISDVSKNVNAILYMMYLSSKPPIESISVPEYIKLGDYWDSDYYHTGDLMLAPSNRSNIIGYLPEGSNKSIKSVEMEYEKLGGVGSLFYTVNSQGEFFCNQGVTTMTPGYIVIVKAKITDIYGNQHLVSWEVRR